MGTFFLDPRVAREKSSMFRLFKVTGNWQIRKKQKEKKKSFQDRPVKILGQKRIEKCQYLYEKLDDFFYHYLPIAMCDYS